MFIYDKYYDWSTIFWKHWFDIQSIVGSAQEFIFANHILTIP